MTGGRQYCLILSACGGQVEGRIQVKPKGPVKMAGYGLHLQCFGRIGRLSGPCVEFRVCV